MKREFAALALLAAVFISPPLLAQAKRNPSAVQIMPAVLMYHDVMDIQQDTSVRNQIIAIRPQYLEEQFRYLYENDYTTLFVSEFQRAIVDHEEIPPKTVVITFDDGTADMYETVLPLIKKYNIKITEFANPGFDGTNGRMTHEQLQEIYKTGLVEIGAHTMDHVNLIETGDDDARMEIRDSKQALEKITGAPVTSFAYPFGKFGYREQKMVADAGFHIAFAADDSHGKSYNDLLAIPRITIGERTPFKVFVRALHGWY